MFHRKKKTSTAARSMKCGPRTIFEKPLVFVSGTCTAHRRQTRGVEIDLYGHEVGHDPSLCVQLDLMELVDDMVAGRKMIE